MQPVPLWDFCAQGNSIIQTLLLWVKKDVSEIKIDDAILLWVKMMHGGIVHIRSLSFLLPHFNCRICFTLFLSLHFLGLPDEDRVCVNAFTATLTSSSTVYRDHQGDVMGQARSCSGIGSTLKTSVFLKSHTLKISTFNLVSTITLLIQWSRYIIYKILYVCLAKTYMYI